MRNCLSFYLFTVAMREHRKELQTKFIFLFCFVFFFWIGVQRAKFAWGTSFSGKANKERWVVSVTKRNYRKCRADAATATDDTICLSYLCRQSVRSGGVELFSLRYVINESLFRE